MNFFTFLEKVNRKGQSFLKQRIYKLQYRDRVKFGKKLIFSHRFRLFSDGYLEIGDNCFFNDDCSLNCLGKIIIGSNCLFGKNVNIYDHNHKYGSEIQINQSGYTIKPVIIGNNVWLGTNVTILAGVSIGNNAVIGAGCILYKDVPDDTVVVNHQNLIQKDI